MKTITELKMVTGGNSDNFNPTLAQCGFAEDFLAAIDKRRFGTERAAQFAIVFANEIAGGDTLVASITKLLEQNDVNSDEMNSVIAIVRKIYDDECPK